jgi:cyclic beta-1,2-glucan synthetase
MRVEVISWRDELMTSIATAPEPHGLHGLGGLPSLLRDGDDPLRAELCGPAALEERARELAGSSPLIPPHARWSGRSLLTQLERNKRFLERAYREVAAAFRGQEPLTPDAEWLLDNFHIVEDVLRNIRHDLPPGYYSELPVLRDDPSWGPLAGLPRIYALALTLVAHTGSSLDEGQILHFVRAYQSVAPLTIGELWAVPTMLRLALLENLRRLSAQVLQNRKTRLDAQRWADRARQAEAARKQPLPLPEAPGDGFVVALLQALRDVPLTGRAADHLNDWLSIHAPANSPRSASEALRREHQRQAMNQVAVGNCVTSLRLLSNLDWAQFFEQASLLEAILRTDPAGVYARQDFTTRDRYRKAVEELARGARLSELDVGRILLQRASEGPFPESHIGWHLLGAGRAPFEQDLGFRPTAAIGLRETLTAHPNSVFFGLLTLFTLILLFIPFAAIGFSVSGWMALVIFLVLLLPVSEVAVALTNFVVCHLLLPRVLPRLDFKEGIPPEFTTFVVMPTMLTRPEGVTALLERLELHYLANPDPQLRFALLTDFGDSPTQTQPGDAELVRLALEGIRKLNEQHPLPTPAFDPPQDRFFLFHRHRQYNAAQGCWMGWERKRGKLEEFNRLLRGDRGTSYSSCSADIAHLPAVPFVLTLDTDTILPREAARRLISTLAHPLNRPVLSADGRRVIAGYGLLQPRVNFLYRTGLRSWFARIFASSAGVDPYSAAVSDVYQDLFGRGTFTGKGLYDVDAFHATAGGAFPENSILSHDLIESTLARCALVTDNEVFDDFPSRYHAYARRDHRWVRGDWQLLPWLAPRVPIADGARAPNVLPFLERWKIVDNLRRSLVPPALILLLALGWLVLPGSPGAWTVLAVSVVAMPVLLFLLEQMISLIRGASPLSLWRQARASFGATAGQALLLLTFLADSSRLNLDAIGRTLWRVFVSRQHMLEWETAAAAEARLGNGWRHFFVNMWPAVALALVLGVLVVVVCPAALPAALPILLLWMASPMVAWFVSQPLKTRERPLDEAGQLRLRQIARKTWGFFETFVGPEDNWLPPDNYQEEPKHEVAHRTSPTNIGMLLLSTLSAHDLGYLTLEDLVRRIKATLDTLDRLELFKGHLLNWYDTVSLHPLYPRYVSTVDSGNLFGTLLTLKSGLCEKRNEPFPSIAASKGLGDVLSLIRIEVEQMRRKVNGSGQPGNEALWLKLSEHLGDLVRRTEELRHPGNLLDNLSRLESLQAEWDTVARQLHGLGDLLAATPDTLTRWVGRFGEQLRHAKAELIAVAPWLDALRDAGLESLSDKKEWHALRQRLVSPTGVAPLAAELPKLRQETATLASGVEGVPRAHLEALERSLADSIAPRLAEELNGLAGRADRLGRGMDFRFLYNAERDLFTIGHNVELERHDQSHYDLLASESCIASFLAVASGEAPRKHWFQLGRLSTEAAGRDGLISWGGTMFEYLMPRLLLPVPAGTLLDVAQTTAVARQIEYARQRGVPWGISESAFNALDTHQNYQYQSFGVPGLGLKRGLTQDLVLAPYACLLAVTVDPHDAISNLENLSEMGAEGPFGFYEAVDCTPARLQRGQKYQVIRSYMAHHQGMALVALTNKLFDDIMPRRLRAEPLVLASELLLQERVPMEAPLVMPHEESEGGAPPAPMSYPVSRQLNSPDTPAPRIHFLSGGRCSLMVTNAGGTYTRCRDLDVTRWRPDRTCDNYGLFIYIRDRDNGAVWSAAYQPTCQRPEKYQVVYSIDKAEYRRIDDHIETVTEIVVSPEKDVGVRRVTLINHDTRPRELEITSYVEIVLLPHGADLAHPAFGKLFLETEWLPRSGALLCRRRQRAVDQAPVWAVHVLAHDPEAKAASLEFETGRASFLGRRRTTANPEGLSRPLTGTTGPVLDPIFSIRRRVYLEPGTTTTLAYVTGVAETREEAVALADTFQTLQTVTRTFELAWAHARVELRHLNLSEEGVHLSQRLAGHLLLSRSVLRASHEVLVRNRQGQSGLWRHGISGDLPILLVRLSEGDDLTLIRQALAAHVYCRAKGFVFDLLVLIDEQDGYFENIYQNVLNLIRMSENRDRIDRNGGVFILRGSHLSNEDRDLLLSAARVVLDSARGDLGTQIDVMDRPSVLPPRRRKVAGPMPSNDAVPAHQKLVFDNGTGGFTPDGKEYIIHAGATPPAPWINVLANPRAGCLISDSGSGYTWVGNSQSNRLTPWSNDPVSDPPGEAIYLCDDETGLFWSPSPLPVPGAAPTRVRHGQGYTIFEQTRGALEQELTVFVPREDPVKIYRLRVSNRGKRTRRLSVTYYAEWVLGTTREVNALYVRTEIDEGSGALLATNPFAGDCGNAVAFVDTNLRPRTLTGDRGEFLGRNGSLASPAALARETLSGRVGPAIDPCAALQGQIELRPGSAQEIVFVIGQAADPATACQLAQQYRQPVVADESLRAIQEFWDHLLGTVQVQTPDAAMDLLLNRWLLYQVMSCRFWGRSAFYQSGGAFGFRDQLQDVMSLCYCAPDVSRTHILRSARRQFVEGDVQHWWHPLMCLDAHEGPGSLTGRGVRTRFSDDFLWLPFVTCFYWKTTGDASIWDEPAPYLKQAPLEANQEEVYAQPMVSDESGTLYEHCVRALDNGWKLGTHHLPLMGIGDWNDGMNKVGAGGSGESVWVAWFQIAILRNFAEIAKMRKDTGRAELCLTRLTQLRRAVEDAGWDGAWYRRAYFDDGTPLGSAQNDECQIDSLTQTWSVIAGKGLADWNRDRSEEAIRHMDERLVKLHDQVLLLFDPPFDTGKLEPGYIKGYVPGIRENGGQYTHAATWMVLAHALLGHGDEAHSLFDILNPICHAQTSEQLRTYRVEPYVVAADVYGRPPHVGRGGWTWYTGSASWLYRVGLEAILGFRREGDRLWIEPCIPRAWSGFTLVYRHRSAVYRVTVTREAKGVSVDGQAVEAVTLADDGREHEVRVGIG